MSGSRTQREQCGHATRREREEDEDAAEGVGHLGEGVKLPHGIRLLTAWPPSSSATMNGE